MNDELSKLTKAYALLSRMAEVLCNYSNWSTEDGDVGNNDDVIEVLDEYRKYLGEYHADE